MAWIPIDDIYEYDDSPPEPGNSGNSGNSGNNRNDNALKKLWNKQNKGIRISQGKFDSSVTYAKCRRIGSTIDTFGELSKSYYDAKSAAPVLKELPTEPPTEPPTEYTTFAWVDGLTWA